MEACLLRIPTRLQRSTLRESGFSLSPSPVNLFLSFSEPSLSLSARREILTLRVRASGEAGTAERCGRPPTEQSGGGGRLCARAHARSPANSGLNCSGPRGEDNFFFSLSNGRARARARGLALGFFLAAACRCARALTPLSWVSPAARGWKANRYVCGVLPQHLQGRTF